MAGIRRRGYVPVLCASVARIGVRQVEPAEDHRRRHGLALSERAQTRAEGVNAKATGRFPMPTAQTRRRFLAAASLAGAAGLVRPPPLLAAEAPLETTAVRIIKSTAICIAPQYIAEELLRAEGFTDIRFVEIAMDDYWEALTEGKVDFGLSYASSHLTAIDAGAPITLLAGVMVGCFELFAREGIGSIAELKGK